MVRRALLITLVIAGLSGCTWGYEQWAPMAPPPPYHYGYYGPPGYMYAPGGYAYGGGQWATPRAPYAGELTGPGVAILDDWLKETVEGRAVVTLGFQDAANGAVSEDVAHRANVWFRRYADRDRDMVLTDPEIRTALVAAAGRYVRR